MGRLANPTGGNRSVAMMNLVEERLAPDDVPHMWVLMDKVKTERYPSLAMIRRYVGRKIVYRTPQAATAHSATRLARNEADLDSEPASMWDT